MSMKRVIAIVGMPRSGTSFVGQIFDSHYDTVFRMEPLFAYKLKNMIDEHSTKEECMDFLQKAYDSDEDYFMNQLDKRESGSYPIFQKKHKDILVIKTTRFHEMLPLFLKYFDEDFLKVVSIVRHPAGSVSSWINHPREFPKGYDYRQEWRSGSCKKTAKEEYWGFDDWKKVMQQHLELEQRYAHFKIFQYEHLVNDIHNETSKLFEFTGLEMNEQTRQFLIDSQSKNIQDPYAVFKDKSVTLKWKRELDEDIQKTIIQEIEGTVLEKFLVEL